MNDRTRTLVAFLVIIAILFIWSFLTKPKTSTTQPVPITSDSLQKTIAPPDLEVATTGDSVVIDRKEIRVVLSNMGGSVKSFYLKAYNENIIPQGHYLFVSKTGEQATDIINFDYTVTADSVIFTRKLGTKVMRKVYDFSNDQGFRLTTYGPDTVRQILSLKSGIGVTEHRNRGEDLRYFNVYLKEGKVNNITKKIKDKLEYAGELDWFALRNKYFILVINNLARIDNIIFYKLPKDIEVDDKTTYEDDGDINKAVFGCPFYGPTASNRYGAEITTRSKIDISVLLLPLKYSELAKFKKGYEEIISGGIWGPIARVILLIFNFIFSIIKNYGFVIIIFAVLIKAIFFPLSKQMIISQLKMQQLQPELKKIQQRYKDDPAKVNQETMHLYKTYKVNPFSGCLPLLIQMPIFFALYQTLATSIEFKQAKFIFWITDLSYKDPYYVLPIGMGIMMLIQSLTTTIDPRQRFMIVIMPIFLVIVFLNLPSGLQLYWFAYNILTLVEQYLTKRGGMK